MILLCILCSYQTDIPTKRTFFFDILCSYQTADIMVYTRAAATSRTRVATSREIAMMKKKKNTNKKKLTSAVAAAATATTTDASPSSTATYKKMLENTSLISEISAIYEKQLKEMRHEIREYKHKRKDMKKRFKDEQNIRDSMLREVDMLRNSMKTVVEERDFAIKENERLTKRLRELEYSPNLRELFDEIRVLPIKKRSSRLLSSWQDTMWTFKLANTLPVTTDASGTLVVEENIDSSLSSSSSSPSSAHEYEPEADTLQEQLVDSTM